MQSVGEAGPLCPVCGRVACSSFDRDEPVKNPESGRDLGWKRTIRTYLHLDGAEHRIPIGVAFEVER